MRIGRVTLVLALAVTVTAGAEARRGPELELTAARLVPERIAPGERSRLEVTVRNVGDALPPNFRVEARRDGRVVWSVRFRGGNRPDPGTAVTRARALARAETRDPGRRCYEVAIRPRDGLAVVGGPRTVCLDVGDAGGGMAGGGDSGTEPETVPRVALLGARLQVLGAGPVRDRGRPGQRLRLVAVVQNVGPVPLDRRILVDVMPAASGESIVGNSQARIDRLSPAGRPGARVEVPIVFTTTVTEAGRRCYRARIHSPYGAELVGPRERRVCVDLPGVGGVRLPPLDPGRLAEVIGNVRARVVVRIPTIRVRYDGDNISDGDWWVAMAVASTGPRTGWSAGASWSSVRNVESGTRITGRLAVGPVEVAADRGLRIGVMIVDCDGGWAPRVDTYVVLGAPGIRAPDCDGEEEVLEATGRSDIAYAELVVPAACVREGCRRRLRVVEFGASKPLSAEVEIEVQPRR